MDRLASFLPLPFSNSFTYEPRHPPSIERRLSGSYSRDTASISHMDMVSMQSAAPSPHPRQLSSNPVSTPFSSQNQNPISNFRISTSGSSGLEQKLSKSSAYGEYEPLAEKLDLQVETEYAHFPNMELTKFRDYIEITSGYVLISLTEPTYTTLQTGHSVITSTRAVRMNLLTNDGRSISWTLGKRRSLPGYISKGKKRRWEEESDDVDPLSMVDLSVTSSIGLEELLNYWSETDFPLRIRISASGDENHADEESFLLPPIPDGWARGAKRRKSRRENKGEIAVKVDFEEMAFPAPVYKRDEHSILPSIETSDFVDENRQELRTLLKTCLETDHKRKGTCGVQRRPMTKTGRNGGVLSGRVEKVRKSD